MARQLADLATLLSRAGEAGLVRGASKSAVLRNGMATNARTLVSVPEITENVTEWIRNPSRMPIESRRATLTGDTFFLHEPIGSANKTPRQPPAGNHGGKLGKDVTSQLISEPTLTAKAKAQRTSPKTNTTGATRFIAIDTPRTLKHC